MYSVLLYFDAHTPDGEDDAIRKYIDDHMLEPKRQTRTQVEDRTFDIMSFGGCYLGPRHMDAIADIQRNVVEREVLAESIPSLLKEGPDSEAQRLSADMDSDTFATLLDELITKHHVPSSFGRDDEGYLQVTLDASAVRASFLEAANLNQNV
jgi:hypothetical protein